MKTKHEDCGCRKRTKTRIKLCKTPKIKKTPIRSRCWAAINSLRVNGIKPQNPSYYEQKSAEFQFPSDNEATEADTEAITLEQQNIINSEPANYAAQEQYASLPRITVQDFVLARTQIPEFRINWCDFAFRFLGYRIVVSYPCIQTRRATFEVYTRVSYPTISNNVDVRQIVNSCAQSAKDDAIERLLFLLPFATVSFGSSVVAAFQQAFTAFQTSFINCLRNTAQGLRPSVRGPYWRSRDRTPWRNLF